MAGISLPAGARRERPCGRRLGTRRVQSQAASSYRPPATAASEAVVCVSNRWDAVRLLQRAPWPGSFLVWLSEQCWELHAAAEHEAELSEAVRALPEWARFEPPRVSGAA
ncbi:MAG: hypothetical protein H0X39_09640 [Actinobacteria bacterium]|nr:hypothetical protein [Actinomycetota bacterium]